MAPAEQLMRLFFSLLIVGGRSTVSDVMLVSGSTVDMDLLTALNVVRNAPESLLRAHTAEIILTLRKVSQRLKTNLLCQSEARLPSPPIPDSSSSQTQTEVHVRRTIKGPWYKARGIKALKFAGSLKICDRLSLGFERSKRNLTMSLYPGRGA